MKYITIWISLIFSNITGIWILENITGNLIFPSESFSFVVTIIYFQGVACLAFYLWDCIFKKGLIKWKGVG
jgi:hypothetical protein